MLSKQFSELKQKRYDIFGVGNTLVDSEYQITFEKLKTIGIPRGRMTLIDYEKACEVESVLSSANQIAKHRSGGSACNTLAAASGFGSKTFFCHNVGNDAVGNHFKIDAQKNGIELDDRKAVIGKTGNCIVLITPDGERTMATHLGVSSDFSFPYINKNALLSSRILYIEGYLTSSEKATNVLLKAIEFAKSNGVAICLTLSDVLIIRSFRKRLDSILEKQVDFLFCNADEAICYTKSTNLEEAMKRLSVVSNNWAITRGKNGVIINDSNQRFVLQAPKVNCIDANGAGDLFAGAFLYGILNGITVKKSGLLAVLASSQLVTMHGNKLFADDYRDIYLKFLSKD